jgi:hypothetical protein
MILQRVKNQISAWMSFTFLLDKTTHAQVMRRADQINQQKMLWWRFGVSVLLQTGQTLCSVGVFVNRRMHAHYRIERNVFISYSI